MRQTETFRQWLAGANSMLPIYKDSGGIGIHDVSQIAHTRTWLWALEDYFVSGVSGGVIWLAPRTRQTEVTK